MLGFNRLPRSAKMLIIYYSLYMIPTVVDIYLIIYLLYLGMSIEKLGYLYSAYFAFIAISKYFVGKALDKFLPPKYVMIVVDITSSAYYFLLSISKSFEDFLIAVSIDGIISPLYVSYGAIERDIFPEELSDVAYRNVYFWPFLTESILFLMIGYILETCGIDSYSKIALFTSAFCIILALYVFLTIPKTRPPRIEKKKVRIVNKALILFFIGSTIMVASYGIAPIFIVENYLFNNLGMRPIFFALFYFIGSFSGMLAPILHKKLDRLRGGLRISFAIILSSFSSAIILLINYDYLLIPLIFISIFYLSDALFWMQHDSFTLRAVPKERRGETYGFLGMLKDFLLIPMPIIAVILAKFMYFLPFIVRSIMILFIIPFYMLGVKYLPKEKI